MMEYTYSGERITTTSSYPTLLLFSLPSTPLYILLPSTLYPSLHSYTQCEGGAETRVRTTHTFVASLGEKHILHVCTHQSWYFDLYHTSSASHPTAPRHLFSPTLHLSPCFPFILPFSPLSSVHPSSFLPPLSSFSVCITVALWHCCTVVQYHCCTISKKQDLYVKLCVLMYVHILCVYLIIDVPGPCNIPKLCSPLMPGHLSNRGIRSLLSSLPPQCSLY